MKIVVRVDASPQIGVGHLMRCLTLAHALKKKDVEVTFITRDLSSVLDMTISSHGYELVKMGNERKLDKSAENYGHQLLHARWLGVSWTEDALQTLEYLRDFGRADWLIVDHYALDKRWEEAVSPLVGKILVIDDLADREHACDLLIDQNSYNNYESRYDNLVPTNCLKLLGPRYALLRQEFKVAKNLKKKRDGRISNILVFFGGADVTNETCKVLHVIKKMNICDVTVNVVVGAANPHVAEISFLSSQMSNVKLHIDIDYISELMVNADLSVGASGSATWERCALGLPSILVAIAENQIEIAKSVEYLGIGMYIGTSSEVTQPLIEKTIRYCFENPHKMSEMGMAATALVDADGCFRVLEKMDLTV
jgi:UDP-2,4-diacetamido-2,4,6-trideoxy-beta-L-altropyranose hydrolase